MGTKIWLTSDHHFNHENILEYTERGMVFNDLDHMNEMLVQIHNERVAPGDIVYFLGDVAMGIKTESLEYVGRMHGTKFLIYGNHDKVFPDVYSHSERVQKWRKIYGQYFRSIVPQYSLFAFGEIILLNHFPYHGDSTDEERYDKFRPVDEGFWLCHGHVHDAAFRYGERMIHVGVDAYEAKYGPISLDQIGEIIGA